MAYSAGIEEFICEDELNTVFTSTWVDIDYLYEDEEFICEFDGSYLTRIEQTLPILYVYYSRDYMYVLIDSDAPYEIREDGKKYYYRGDVEIDYVSEAVETGRETTENTRTVSIGY